MRSITVLALASVLAVGAVLGPPRLWLHVPLRPLAGPLAPHPRRNQTAPMGPALRQIRHAAAAGVCTAVDAGLRTIGLSAGVPPSMNKAAANQLDVAVNVTNVGMQDLNGVQSGRDFPHPSGTGQETFPRNPEFAGGWFLSPRPDGIAAAFSSCRTSFPARNWWWSRHRASWIRTRAVSSISASCAPMARSPPRSHTCLPAPARRAGRHGSRDLGLRLGILAGILVLMVLASRPLLPAVLSPRGDVCLYRPHGADPPGGRSQRLHHLRPLR